MFRYEVGATILVKRRVKLDYEPTEVKILAKATNHIKVKILSDGWFRRGEVRILANDEWFSIGRIKDS